jgi:hypothetical protein
VESKTESKTRDEKDKFRSRIKEQWGLLWTERFDDRVRAEGVSVNEYPLLFMSRGHVIFASRDAKAPSFTQIVEAWASRGMVYSPDPDVGGWGKFFRTEIKKVARSRARAYVKGRFECEKERQHLKKGGRGWLHK